MKTTLIPLILLFFATSSHSQVVGFKEPIANVGVKLGGNIEYLSSSPLRSGFGPLAGIYARRGIGKFALRLEVDATYVQYKTKYPAAFYSNYVTGMDTVTAGNFQVIYVNIPLLFEYVASEKWSILAGPQFGYVASITDKNKVYEGIYGNSNIIANTDFSIVAGAEFKIAKRMELGARIVKGVIDVNNSTYYLVHKPWSSSGAQVSVSYRIL